MREDSLHVRRSFQVTEVTAMVQKRSGEARRIRCQVRGIWKDEKRLLALVKKLFDSEEQSVSFIIDKAFYLVKFDMPVDKYIVNADEISREKITP